MSLLHKTLLNLGIIVLATGTYAEESKDPLGDLIKKVQSEQINAQNINKSREEFFSQKLSEQKKNLDDAIEKLKIEKSISEKLRSEFEKNEFELSNLEKKLDLTMGTLGEMYGVVRQVASDTYANFESSIITLQHPDRLGFLKRLSNKKELASTDQLKRLWFELLTDMNESGKIVNFSTNVVDTAGKSKVEKVVRVGSFNLVRDGAYLQYLPETRELTVLARQPDSDARASTENVFVKDGEFQSFTLDPSRGVLLSKMVNTPSLDERLEQGGVVGYVILAVLLCGVLIVCERFYRLRKVDAQISTQLASKEILSENPLGKIFSIYSSNSKADVESLEIKLNEAVIRTVSPLEKGISTVKILAAIAPLLGLLGTVTGMIGTFQSITLFGTGDPKLMAGGISQALVTTVLGLVAAIPLILLHSLVASRCKKITSVLEEQAAGLLVERIEAREV